MNIYDFLETSIGRRLMSLPAPLLDSAIGAVANMGLFSYGRFVKQVITATDVADDQEGVRRIEHSLRQANARYFVDLGTLMHTREAVVRDRFANVRCEGLEIWRDIKGEGAILMSAHFACFYIGAFAPGVFQDILLVSRYYSPSRDDLLKRISKLTGKTIEMAGLTDKNIGLRLLGKLRRAGTVAVMMDYFYEDTNLVITNFMGAPAATPAGLAMMAVRTKRPVIPVFMLRDSEGYLVRIEEPVVMPDDSCSMEEATFILASRMNAVIEQTVRRFPEQWTFWPSLPRRWDYARRTLSNLNQETLL